MATSRELDIINVADIVVPEGRRPVGAEAVASLATSLDVIGLRTPITVRLVDNMDIDGHPTDGVPVLITGAHRLAAAKHLGWESIECWISPGCDEIDAEMWELAENLHRVGLTKEQRDEHIRRYAELVQLREEREKAPEKLRQSVGVSPATGGRGNKGVASKVAEETGLSARTVQRVLNPKPTKPAKIAADPLNDFEAREKQVSRLMSAWNAASPEAREQFLARIDKPVFDSTGAA